MKKLILLLCLLPLLASTCHKYWDACREFPVSFHNNSSDTLIFAYKITKNGQCYLDGWKIAPDGYYSPDPVMCKDGNEIEGVVLEFHIVNPDQFVNHKMVDCATLNDHYPILKSYSLTRDALEKTSTIEYLP